MERFISKTSGDIASDYTHGISMLKSASAVDASTEVNESHRNLDHSNDPNGGPSAVLSQGTTIQTIDQQQQEEAQIAMAAKIMLENMGEDPTREGLLKTPERFAKALRFLTSGYRADLHTITNNAIFTVDTKDLVLVRNINISSLCEHHLLPFTGRVHIGYIPCGRVLGLSKLARIAEMYGRRLQVQERLTNQVAEAIEEVLNPDGVAVVMECSHMCMAMRGVQQPNASTMTECKTGVFKTDVQLEQRFHQLLRMAQL